MGRTTHGLSRRRRKHPLYNVWANMKYRCLRPAHPAYPRYGGRGITVNDRWLESFANFVADMGPRPQGYTIERRNNDGPYSPDNCLWATYKQQAANKAPAFARMEPIAAEASRRQIRDAAARANAARKKPAKPCRQCGQPIERQGYTVERFAPKFCSRACYGTSLLAPDRTCVQCGQAFHPRRTGSKYCSKPCFWEARRHEAKVA